MRPGQRSSERKYGMDSRQIVAIVEAIFFKGCSLFEARAILDR
jgi:hypothetical protein